MNTFKQIGFQNDDVEFDDDVLRRMSFRYSSPEDGSYSVNIEDVQKLVKMCGGDLNKFENFYLLKRSSYEGSNLDSTRDVTCQEFTDAVESYVNDANTDPQSMIMCLFKLKFGED